MRSPGRLERYRHMSPAEKLREFQMLEQAAYAVWRALPQAERLRRRALARRMRLARHARLLQRLVAPNDCPAAG